MAGDDTTPDPLFKNVPRRPSSAAASAHASWPRKEEPDGGDPSGGSGASNNASPPATSVASNKLSPSTGGGAEHVPRAKKHRVAPTEEPEPEPEGAKDRGIVGALDRHGILGGRMPPALSHKDKAAAAAAAASAAASSSSDSEPDDVDWAENERWRKGKTPVVNDEDDDACAAVARRRRPPAGSGHGKLMGDAIRSHGSTAVAGSFEPSSRTTKRKKPAKKKHRTKSKKEKPTKKGSGDWFWCGMGTGSDAVSSAGSDADYSFDRIGVVSDRLRTTLRGLGVAAPGPVRVYGKLLSASDRVTQQSRLLMSCKRWFADGAEFPICEFLTEEERREAHAKGLALTAYDRGGDAYELSFRYLKSNGAYRLITQWSDFLKHNGLVVRKVVGEDEPEQVGDDVMLDLWLFRPHGGKVRMVVLHYRRGDAAHADAALDEVEQKRLEEVEQKRLEEEEQQRRQLMLNNGDAAGAAGRNNGNDDDDDAIMEDVVGDANEVAGVNGGEEQAAAAPAPSSPSSEPSGGGATEAATSWSPSESDDGVGAKASAEEQAGALLGEVADSPSSTPSELHGGAGRSDEVTAPLSLGGDGTEEEEEAGGALMVMVLEVEAVTQSSLDSDAGGEANQVAAPPSSTEEADGGAAMMAMEDAVAAELEAAARLWNVTVYEYLAALGLVMLSKANSNS